MPYTYVIDCPDGRKYYGVRYSKDSHEDDLWKTYFTSSKEIHEMIQIYGKDNFKYEVRRKFDCKEKAINWESRVLKRLKVRTNEKWVNKTDNESIPSMYGEENPSKRKDVKEKISKSKTGKKRPDQSKRLLEKHHMKTEESRKKVSDTRKELFRLGILQPSFKGEKRQDISGEKHPRYGKKFEKLSKMNSIEYICPHCNKIGKGPGMKRYHFDNCKILLSVA